MARRKSDGKQGKAARKKGHSTNLPEVLDLVISTTLDASLLCKCTVVSSYFRELAATQVKTNLPQLLMHAIKQAAQAPPKRPTCVAYNDLPASNPIKWLCATAGPEVVARPEVTGAVLSPSMVVVETFGSLRHRGWAWSQEQLFGYDLACAGLTLTDAQVAAAARQQLPPLADLSEAIMLQERETGLTELCQEVLDGQLHPGTLRQQPVSGDTVADMLFIACNEGHSDAFHTLLEFDQTNTHALGTVPILTMKGSQRWGSKLAKTAQQQQGQLAEQLLLTCIAANQPLCMAQLVKVAPAVYYVSASGVASLMQAAAMLGNKASDDDYYHKPRSTLDALSRLPAAKDVPSADIESVVRTLLHQGQTDSRLKHLFKLPGALSMSSGQICSLLLLAARLKADSITCSLARLGGKWALQRADLLQLLLTTSNELAADHFINVLEDIQPLKVWKHITAEDMLLILANVAKNRSYCSALELFKAASKALHFSSKPVIDASKYLTFLKALIRDADVEDLDNILDVLRKTKSINSLGHRQYLELLQYCVVQESLPPPLLKLSVAQEVSAAEVYSLLLLCFGDRPARSRGFGESSSESDAEQDSEPQPCSGVVADLLDLPGAQQLTKQQIGVIQRLALQAGSSGLDSKLIPKLLALPAAKGISKDSAKQQLLATAAAEPGAMTAVERLRQQVQACAAAGTGMDPQVMRDYIEATLSARGSSSQFEIISSLLQQPWLQQYSADVLSSVLLAALRSKPPQSDMWGRYGLQMRHSRPSRQEGYQGIKVRLTVHELRQLLELPAASDLSAAVVQQLMHLSVSRMGGALLQELVGLPAAAQLSTAAVQELLQVGMGMKAGQSSSADTQATAVQPATAVLQAAGTRAAQARGSAPLLGRLASLWRPKRQQQQQTESRGPYAQAGALQAGLPAQSELAQLVQQCLQHPRGCTVLFPLLHLPWARQLPAAVVCSLLQCAAERQAKSTFDHLMQLPQAPRGDAEVERYAQAMRLCVGEPHLCDFATSSEQRGEGDTDGDDTDGDDTDGGDGDDWGSSGPGSSRPTHDDTTDSGRDGTDDSGAGDSSSIDNMSDEDMSDVSEPYDSGSDRDSSEY